MPSKGVLFKGLLKALQVKEEVLHGMQKNENEIGKEQDGSKIECHGFVTRKFRETKSSEERLDFDYCFFIISFCIDAQGIQGTLVEMTTEMDGSMLGPKDMMLLGPIVPGTTKVTPLMLRVHWGEGGPNSAVSLQGYTQQCLRS